MFKPLKTREGGSIQNKSAFCCVENYTKNEGNFVANMMGRTNWRVLSLDWDTGGRLMYKSQNFFLDALNITFEYFLLNRIFQHVENKFFRRAHEMAHGIMLDTTFATPTQTPTLTSTPDPENQLSFRDRSSKIRFY